MLLTHDRYSIHIVPKVNQAVLWSPRYYYVVDHWLSCYPCCFQGEPSRTSVAELFITVADINDNRPAFAFNEYNLTVGGDDLQPGIQITTVHADDLDTGPNAEIRYSMTVISHGTARFVIGEESGSVFVSGLDAAGDYVLNITATDGGQPPLSANMRLYVTILKSNATTTTTTTTTTTPPKSSTVDPNASGARGVFYTSAIQSLLVAMFLVVYLHTS